MDALKAEFPGATAAVVAIRRPSIASGGMWQAFLTGVGAALVVRAIAELAVVSFYGIVFPATAPHPAWLTPASIWDTAAEVAAGMVLMRAGGLAPLALYVGLELVVVLASLPGRLLFCSRAGADITNVACDYPTMIASRWPLWLALATGVALSRVLVRREGGRDELLFAAGALSLVLTLANNVSALWLYTGTVTDARTLAVTGMASVGSIAGGLLAGALLWRSTAGRVLLLALCVLGPGLAFDVPLLRANLAAPPSNPQPATYWLSLWSGIFVPFAGAIAVFAGWSLRRDLGTDF